MKKMKVFRFGFGLGFEGLRFSILDSLFIAEAFVEFSMSGSSNFHGNTRLIGDIISVIISFVGSTRDLARFSQIGKLWNHWCLLSLASKTHQQTKQRANRKLTTRNSGRPDDHDYYLVVMGGGGVGKTALVTRFIEDRFTDNYRCGVEDSFRKQASIDEEIAVLHILDTAGQEEYNSYRKLQLRQGQGFLLVYSIAERRWGFNHEIERIYEQIERVLECEEGKRTPMVLVGNKVDLEDEREISKENGVEMAERLGLREEEGEFFEISAKTGTNVEEAFFSLVRLIRKARVPALPRKPAETQSNRCTLC